MNKKLAIYLLLLTFIVFSCDTKDRIVLEEGVSLELASERNENIDVLSYTLDFDIPESSSEPINVKENIIVKLKGLKPVVLDFKGELESVRDVIVNGKEVTPELSNGHVLLPQDAFKKGANEIELSCVASDLALNRKDDYMYTLFVPNRASSAFVCFDQPDLKAQYDLSLTIPDNWQTVSGGKIINQVEEQGKKRVTFEKTAWISTYLFSFVAGDFESETSQSGMTMYHREPDQDLVERNTKEIFELHDHAVQWLEEYTGIPFPFDKLDIVAIPGFQFGGMEHVGAIQYRADLLMLDQAASLDQRMRRASLIAHEVAHMWFGNLVTMKWFDDVWMKEVFANFMADKIVEEMFPDENHDLKFLLTHHPAAYSIDRTAGANPIRQPLENLDNAASLYGSIIYHKAPIAMQQLELMTGKIAMRRALEDYLTNYAHDNADWNDLIQILDRIVDSDLSNWSKIWIESAGRPEITFTYIDSPERSEYIVESIDPSGQGRLWPQKTSMLLDYGGGPVKYELSLTEPQYVIERKSNKERPSFVQLNLDGNGYGLFSYGQEYVKEDFIFNRGKIDISDIDHPLQRASAYLTLHEYVLEKGFHPELYFTFLKAYVRAEQNDLILKYLLDNLTVVFNRFFNQEMRDAHIEALEEMLWEKINAAENIKTKSLLLDRYIELSQSSRGLRQMRGLWEGDLSIPDYTLSSRQKERLVLNVVFKGEESDLGLLRAQMDGVLSEDKRNKLRFLEPALSWDQETLASFNAKLQSPENRQQETWVLEALYFLHHPNREEKQLDFLKPSLELLEEIKETNTIFFPKRWLDRALAGYNSQQACDVVSEYLDQNESLDPQLRIKLLQSADMLYRANKNMKFYQSL